MSQPSAYEQYMLELINADRAAAGVAPLAFNGDLNEAAENHSSWMIATDIFSHTGVGGSTPEQRVTAAGYSFNGTWFSGENISWMSNGGAAGFQDEVDSRHASLMASPGHRANLLNGNFREIGVGFETGEMQGWDASVVTQNFALSGTSVFLTGAAFDDRDGDLRYDVGEGLGGLTVTAVNGAGQSFATTTMDAGGYNLDLAAGAYTVTFSGGGFATTTQQVTIGGGNVKLDLVDPQAGPPPFNPIDGTSAGETLRGTAVADWINGLAGNDRLQGGGDNDVLNGGGGRDLLFGDTGRDRLIGGGGNDVLTGGAQRDTFIFKGNWGVDSVADFQNGFDKLDLRGNGLSFAGLDIAAADLDGDGAADDALIDAGLPAIRLLNVGVAALDASDFLL